MSKTLLFTGINISYTPKVYYPNLIVIRSPVNLSELKPISGIDRVVIYAHGRVRNLGLTGESSEITLDGEVCKSTLSQILRIKELYNPKHFDLLSCHGGSFYHDIERNLDKFNSGTTFSIASSAKHSSLIAINNDILDIKLEKYLNYTSQKIDTVTGAKNFMFEAMECPETQYFITVSGENDSKEMIAFKAHSPKTSGGIKDLEKYFATESRYEEGKEMRHASHLVSMAGNKEDPIYIATHEALLEERQKHLITQKYRNEAMIVTVKRSKENLTQKWLEEGSDINFQLSDGLTALSVASGSSSLETIDFLISAKADLDINENNNLWTPIFIAISKNRNKVVSKLKEAGANLAIQDKFGCTPLRLAITDGILKGDSKSKYIPLPSKKEKMNRIISKNVTPYPSPSFEKKLLKSNIGAVELLIDSGTLNTLDHAGCTPLITALRAFPEIVSKLINAKADVNISDKNGMSPLHHAVLKLDIEEVTLPIKAGANLKHLLTQLIEANAELDIQDKEGYTPLNCASLRGNLRAVEILISVGAKLDIQDYLGNSPLLSAILNNKTEVARKLIYAEASVNLADNQGFTPLQRAIMGENNVLIKLLLYANAEVSTSDAFGQTPMFVAIATNNIYAVTKLIRAKATLHNQIGVVQKTPIDYARSLVSKGLSADIVKHLAEAILEEQATALVFDIMLYLTSANSNYCSHVESLVLGELYSADSPAIYD